MKPLIFFALAVLLAGTAPAAERVALVIGNNAYRHGVPLDNCLNDARAVAAALRTAGFEVTAVEDAGLAKMEEQVLAFRRAAQGAKAAWFYYSGHGTEVKGSNYLIPVDAEVKEEFQVKHKTLALDQVLGAMEEAGAPLKVVVLDCCRDNPFGKGWSRSSGQGLGQVGQTPQGTIIAFATAPGKVAADGAGPNSPYTTALVAALNKPGLDVKDVFNETGRAVLATTQNQQQPWVNSSFFDSFVLRPGGASVVPVSPPPRALPVEDRSKVAVPRAGDERDFKIAPGVMKRFCWIPAGSFQMGSPAGEEGRDKNETQHQVTLSKGFWLAKHECTQGEWKAVMGDEIEDLAKLGSWSKTLAGKGASYPMYYVSWMDICGNDQRTGGFLARANRHAPLGWRFELPTEAQWEYACRAGGSGAHSGGTLDEVGWYGKNSGKKARPVGTAKKSNGWGLCDMHGNVREWCRDWHGHYPSGSLSDPTGASSGVNRVNRGGSWGSNSADSRAAFRGGFQPGCRIWFLGFRPALVPSGSK